MFGIYIHHEDTDSFFVLLIDGAFINEKSCFKKEYGVVWHRPKLFATVGGAKNFAIKRGMTSKRYKIRKYHGPTGDERQ